MTGAALALPGSAIATALPATEALLQSIHPRNWLRKNLVCHHDRSLQEIDVTTMQTVSRQFRKHELGVAGLVGSNIADRQIKLGLRVVCFKHS